MRLRSSCLALFFLLSAASAAAFAEGPPPAPPAASPPAASPAEAAAEPPAFEVVKLAEGVHAVLRKEPPGFMADSNVVFLISPNDVIVVDTNIGPASAKETLAALRRLTSQPVRYVVNTHWHADHVLGNEVFRDAFPGVELIAQTISHTAPADPVWATIHDIVELTRAAPPVIARMKSQMAEDRNLAGGPLSEEERASYESDIRLAERFLAEYALADPGARHVWPTMEVADQVAFLRGPGRIEVRHLGWGHTHLDLVVHLPEQGILIAGDLVTWPVPRLHGASYPAAHLETLQSLVALKPRVIVPGHGPVLRDLGYVRLVIRLLTSLTRQVRAAVERGETLAQARKSVDLESFRQLIAGDSPVNNALFETFVAGSGVAAAYREATESDESLVGRCLEGPCRPF
jgi:cyclase